MDTVYDSVTEAVAAMLGDAGEWLGRTVTFETLGTDSGIAFFASGGSRLVSETRDVTGGGVLRYAFPFRLVWRAASTSERQKLAVSDGLERICAWLCGDPVDDGGEVYLLREYPAVRDGRIVRVTPGGQYANEPYANGVQDRVLPFTVEVCKPYANVNLCIRDSNF